MQRRRSTKRALSTSLLALLLCVAMLVGTTFAWFTDSVTSGTNQITSGNLDVELKYMDDAGNWLPVQNSTALFNSSALWEPGHTEVVYLQVSNLGSLALKYQLGVNIISETGSVNKAGDAFLLSKYVRFGVVEGVSTRYASRQAARNAVTTSELISAGYSKASSLYPAASGKTSTQYVALVVYMPEEIGNVANHAADATPPTIELGVDLVATQEMEESDNFGNDYDEDATFPNGNVSMSVTVPVDTTNDGKTTAATTMANENGSVVAQVPAGVQLADGVTKLTFTVKKITDSAANITLEDGETARALDVHIEGIATDNDVPIAVTIKGMLPKSLNMGNYNLYHVENGSTNKMTLSTNPTAHNEYSYDSATGDVTMLLKSFSEVAYTANTSAPWGGSMDTTWYNTKDTEFTLYDADDLAGFGAIVGGMAEGIEQDSFSNKTVKLAANINLDDMVSDNGKVFYPIGYHNNTDSYEKKPGGAVTSDVESFEGTFDGQGHIISNFYQNTWEMFGDYNSGYTGTPNHYKDAMGLFGYVLNGTVKNLTVNNFSSDGEFTPTGVIAAYAVNSTFENIAITNCNPRVYNTGNGGIVGIGGDSSDTSASKLIFKNITIDNTNKISALWGSWDVACGGLMGMFFGPDDVKNASRIEMTNCHVAAQIDVNNDVCGNYQYYWYRYSGMMVGTIDYHTTENGYTVPNTSMITAKDCTVHFDNWNDYYYCELVANSLASYTHDHQFSRLEVIDSLGDIQDEDGNWNRTGNFLLFGENGKRKESGEGTCYHIMKDASGNLYEHKHDVADSTNQEIYETVNGKTVLKENNQRIYLPFNQLFTGYGWGVKNIPVYNGEDYAFEEITVLDREIADSVEKFAGVAGVSDKICEVSGETEFALSEFFTTVDGAEINKESVVVTVDLATESKTAAGANCFSYEFSRAEGEDQTWDQGKLCFKSTYIGEGDLTVEITIQDYKYCTPTTVTVQLHIDNRTGSADIIEGF